jgi:hypothetical protein
LSIRWERTFCDGYEALMRLYLHPQARAQAERVAALLRAVRLLQVEHGTPEPPPFSPPMPLESNAAESPDERKRRRADMALNFFGGMEGWHEKVRRSYQEKADQVGSLLREALAEATALAESSGA